MPVGERKNIDLVSAPSAPRSSQKRVAWLFPGLGSRFVGMGADIIGSQSAADELIAAAEQWLGYDIGEVCLTGSGRKFVPPRIEAQVIYVINCAYEQVLRDQGTAPDLVCGHSLGTWAALYAAGAIDFETGLELVTTVEDALAPLDDADDQAMGVVIGLAEEVVRGWCDDEFHVYLANFNSHGQYVIAGAAAGVDAVLANAAQLGAKKAMRIAGSRAMHTPLIADAGEPLKRKLALVPLSDATVPLLTCDEPRLIRAADDLRGYLEGFLERPVHWEEAMRTAGAMGVERYLEVGAAPLLTGMMPFIDPTARIETAADWLARNETAETPLT